MRACRITRTARSALALARVAAPQPIGLALTRMSARPISTSVFAMAEPKAEEKADAEPEPKAEATDSEAAEAAEEKPAEDSASATKEVEELRAQVKAMADARLRALAELENVRRIAERDVDKARTYAIQKFAKQLLDVGDNLQRALDLVPGDHTPDSMDDETAAKAGRALVSGVQATSSELQKVFKLNGITSFGEAGEKFDPNTMEAMFVMPISDDLPAGSVGQVLMRGYKFKDRVLRPAQVGATPVQ